MGWVNSPEGGLGQAPEPHWVRRCNVIGIMETHGKGGCTASMDITWFEPPSNLEL